MTELKGREREGERKKESGGETGRESGEERERERERERKRERERGGGGGRKIVHLSANFKSNRQGRHKNLFCDQLSKKNFLDLMYNICFDSAFVFVDNFTRPTTNSY